jgi:hypothetical protein
MHRSLDPRVVTPPTQEDSVRMPAAIAQIGRADGQPSSGGRQLSEEWCNEMSTRPSILW